MNTGTHYTAEEIMSIIDKASEKGMMTVEFPGFKGAFALPKQGRLVPSVRETEKPRKDFGKYVCPLKKFRGRMLEQIPRKDLSNYYYEYLLEADEPSPILSEMIENTCGYLDQIGFLRQA